MRGGVIPSQDSLIGDLLTMDLGGPAPSTIPSAVAPSYAAGGLDLLGGGLDSLLSDVAPPAPNPIANLSAPSITSAGLLGDIFGLTSATTSTSYVAPKQVPLVILFLIHFGLHT